MSGETILFLTNLETPMGEINAAAEAARTSGAHLAVLVHTPLPTLPINATGALPYGGHAPLDGWSEEISTARSALSERCAAVDKALADASASGDTRPLICASADIRSSVAQSARTSDVAVMATNLRDAPGDFKDMLHGVLFQSPIGVILNAPVARAPKHIMIGWDDSPAAAHAIHAALPMLKSAGTVTIALFDPEPLSDGSPYEPGAAMAQWLVHHGCRVTVTQYPTGGAEVATSLLKRAHEIGADLIVTGAYGHSRLRQAVFGGTTRSLMEQTEHPVFMAH